MRPVMASAGRDDTPEREAGATVSIEAAQRQRTGPRVARLTVVYPRALAAVHRLGGEVTLGRDVLGHPTVSRRHAQLRRDAGRQSVVDLGSRNGTWLDGQPVGTMARFVNHGAVLRVGEVIMVVEHADAEPTDASTVSRTAIPGESMAAQQLRAAIGRAGPDRAPVLVMGETGSGKESVAAEIHRLSGRRGPLVTINCAALSPQLIESQLFGHVRGAFTGASAEHAGLFRAAAGGTLFLDELGELPLELQPKLLRAVELGEVMAVGSTQKQKVDVRLVAATNRSLADEVEAGKFRQDLYARLALWEVNVPPLRARRVDLVGWIDRVHRVWCEERGRGAEPPLEFTAEAAEALHLSGWRDNLRGLQRLVHVLAANQGRIDRPALPAWVHAAPAAEESTERASEPKRTVRPRPSREELVAVLTANAWSVRATAKHYGRERKQISRWIEQYAIDTGGRAED